MYTAVYIYVCMYVCVYMCVYAHRYKNPCIGMCEYMYIAFFHLLYIYIYTG